MPPPTTTFPSPLPVPQTCLLPVLPQVLSSDADWNLEICEEVEVRTNKRKRQTEPSTSGTKKAKNNTATTKAKSTKDTSKSTKKAQSRKPTRKAAKQPLFSKVDRCKIAEIDKNKLAVYVNAKVSSELFAECFPERALLWGYIEKNQLTEIIESTAEKYLQLYYSNNARAQDKNSVLFLGWLNLLRSLTSEFVDNETSISVSKATKRTLFVMVLNAIYLGLSKQMAETVEQISVNYQSACTGGSKPSDDIAMHRICGWALKSVKDHLASQSDKFKLANDLTLPSSDKHLLPLPVQYLDRGGLTFLKPKLWPWMASLEGRIIQHLNQKCYRQYGSKLFEV